MANGQIQLPPGYEDAVPVVSGSSAPQPPASKISLPPGYEDAVPVGQSSSSTQPAPDALTKTEDFIHNAAQGVGEAAGDVWGAVKSNIPGPAHDVAMVKGIWDQLPPIELLHNTQQILPVINAYEKARKSGASISDAIKASDDAARQHMDMIQKASAAAEAFKANPTRETAHLVTDAAAMAAAAFGGGELGAPAEAEAPSFAAAPAEAESPSIVQQVLKGRAVEQPGAQAALRQNPWASARSANQSLRTTLDHPVEIVRADRMKTYDAVDKAAGTDIKALHDKLNKINDAIDITADPDVEARLEKARTQTMDYIADARQAVVDKLGPKSGSLLDKADGLYTRERALMDVRKSVFKNPNIVEGSANSGTPETVNVDSAVKALQKLQDNDKYGAPRLEQAFGKDGAKAMLDDLYAAQRSGVKALKTQVLIKKLALYTAVGTAMSGAGDLIHKGIAAITP